MMEIKIFTFVISTIFVLKYVFDVGLKLYLKIDEPIVINNYEKLSLLVTLSYVITSIIICLMT